MDPTRRGYKGRWDNILEEEYIKVYVETASGTRTFEIRSNIQEDTKAKPHKCLFLFLSIPRHPLVLTAGDRIDGPEEFGMCSHPYVLSLCLNKTLTSKDFVYNRFCNLETDLRYSSLFLLLEL